MILEVTENLAFFAGKRMDQITLEDIEVVPKTLQDNVRSTQMILKRQIDQARNLVKDLRLQGR